MFVLVTKLLCNSRTANKELKNFFIQCIFTDSRKIRPCFVVEHLFFSIALVILVTLQKDNSMTSTMCLLFHKFWFSFNCVIKLIVDDKKTLHFCIIYSSKVSLRFYSIPLRMTGHEHMTIMLYGSGWGTYDVIWEWVGYFSFRASAHMMKMAPFFLIALFHVETSTFCWASVSHRWHIPWFPSR